MKAISFGEIVWDVYPDNACLGGAPLNFAAHLARHGHKVYMLSAVGKDDYADRALTQMNAWGIDTTYVAQLEDKKTGVCLVSLDADGVPTYDLLKDVSYDSIPLPTLPEADVLYFGTLALRSEYNRRTLQTLLAQYRFSDVFVDINIRAPFYSEESVRFAVQHATVLKISDEELPTVASLLSLNSEEPHAFMAELMASYPSVKCLILTRGGDGAYVYHRAEDTIHSCDSRKVDVVSTVGAGDSFSAAFMHMYGDRKPIPECANYASAVAGFVVSRQDAVPFYDPQKLFL